MKTSAWRRLSTSRKHQSGWHPGRRRPVENLSLVDVNQLKTSVWKPQCENLSVKTQCENLSMVWTTATYHARVYFPILTKMYTASVEQ